MLGSHLTTTSLWYCLALFSTTISHCGYHLPLLPSPEFHDFHHLRRAFGRFWDVCCKRSLYIQRKSGLLSPPSVADSTSALAYWASWTGSTPPIPSSGRPSSTSATRCSPASLPSLRASPTLPRKASDQSANHPGSGSQSRPYIYPPQTLFKVSSLVV